MLYISISVMPLYRAMHATHASAVSTVVILSVRPSVRLSLRPSVARLLGDKTKLRIF